MKKNSSTINKNKIEKTKRKIKIKISNIATRVIYLVIFNEFLYQNKFEIEKHIKFVIETDTHTNRPKTRNPPKTKIIPELKYVVLCVFKVKKKHLNVAPFIMKDTKINRFGA